MAIMIPDVIPTHQSEEIIFNNLKHAAQAREWIVLHSINVENPKHSEKPREIDFVILIPEYCSVICLDAKAGGYDLRGGRWYSSYATEPLEIPPPDRARSAMFALQTQFRTYFSNHPALSIGCAVAFTDAKEPDSSLTHQAKLIWADDALDPDGLSKKIEEHAKALSNDIQVAQQENLDKLRSELENNMTSEPIKRPETIIRSDLATLRPHLLRLTTDQLNSLKRVKLNDRCVIYGAAGTGKTVLAMELARRRCEEEGETVALLCSNPNLSDRFDKWAKTLSEASEGRVVAGTPATLPNWAFREASDLRGKHHRRLNASPGLEESLRFRYWESQWEKFIDETVEDLKQVGEGVFDYLIVDEAQNMCDKVFLKLMDALLKDGLADGRWTMFGDFKYQNIVSPDFHKKAKKVLKDFGLNWTNDELETNCRNTHEIASAVAKFVDIDSPPISGVHGPLVQLEYFSDQDELEDMLDRLVNSLKGRDFGSQQIILLSSDADNEFGRSTYGGWELKNIGEIRIREHRGQGIEPHLIPAGPDNILRYSNIYDFQGLESEVAILVMPVTGKSKILAGSVTLPNFKHLQRILYIGMSRAKAMLIIVADKNYKQTLKRRQRIRHPPSHS